MERYGAQLDVQGGRLGPHPWLSVSGHLFWRDPKVGLIGLYGSQTAWFTAFGTAQVTQAAVEGEVYWDRWTLQGIVGVEFGNSIGRSASSVFSTSVTTPIPGGTTTTVSTTLSTFFEGFDVKTRYFD